MEKVCFSSQCEDCPIGQLVSGIRGEASDTVDVLLETHSVTEIKTIDDPTLYNWIEMSDQFTKAFNTDMPIEFDMVFLAVRKIAEGSCQARLSKEGEI